MPSLRAARRSVDMEAPCHSTSLTPDFRKAEVLYLLSRGALLEHPHMINVQYVAHQPGPTLRDVKACLIALRGKGMPDSFSWSYKRNYKDTFIWCDLFDDDFILPLAESGEYILKAMELFDASQDFSDGEIAYHSARESLPIRRTFRVTSLRKSSRSSSTRSEHLHRESDVPMPRKNGVVLFGEADTNIASESSMDLSKQIKKTLSHSQRAPEARSIEVPEASDDSVSPSFEDLVENKKYNAAREGPTWRSLASRTKRTVAVKRCNSSPHCAYRESDDTTSCQETSAVGVSTPTIITEKDVLLAVFSPSPTTTPDSAPVRRRTWEKEIDKITIYADNKSSDDEHLDVPVREESLQESSGAPCSAVPEDSFLYLLKKATRLRSFRPRLCRGVDVVDSTRTKTSNKIHFRTKAKEEVNKLLFKSPVKHARALFDEPARKSANSFAELVRKNQIRFPERTILPEKTSKTLSEKPAVEEFKTLAEYFESKENLSPSVLMLMNEPHSVVGSPRHHLSIAQPESRPPDSREVNPPRPEPRPFGNDALEVTYRETMEVLEQLPTSRRVGKTGAIRRLSLEIDSEAEISPVSQGEAKKIRSESKGNKQEVKVDSRHRIHSGRAAKIPEDSPKIMTSNKRRASKVKELSGGASASSETLAGSYRSEAAAKTSDEEETIETLSTTPKRLPLEKTSIGSLVQRPASRTFDFRTLHSGNKQGVKMAIRSAAMAGEPPSKQSSSEGAKGWPFEQPVRPRDFKSREDRLLIPGVTHMDWERSFQEAAMHSGPPVDLVFHACLQCGRTFKLDSLQIHMRGCHVINKPKHRKRPSL